MPLKRSAHTGFPTRSTKAPKPTSRLVGTYPFTVGDKQIKIHISRDGADFVWRCEGKKVGRYGIKYATAALALEAAKKSAGVGVSTQLKRARLKAATAMKPKQIKRAPSKFAAKLAKPKPKQ